MSSSDSGGETMEGQEAPEGPEGLEHFEHGYEQQQQEHNADDVGDLFGGSEDEAESHAQARDDDDWMNAGPAGGRLRRGASHGDFGGRNPRAGLEHFGAALDRQQQNQSRGEAVGAPGPSRGPRRIDDDEESEANDELPIGGASHDPDGSESMGSGAQADLTFDGFDDRMFKVEGEPVPLLRSSGELWTALSGNLGPLEMRPKRAMRLGIISPFFRRDAEFFKQWQLPKGHESRAQATAALVSLLFAGTAMGLVSGKHEEKTRSQHQEAADQADAAAGGAGKKKATPQLSHVSRYTYIPAADEQDSHPMFQIGLEELYNEEQTEVLALARLAVRKRTPFKP